MFSACSMKERIPTSAAAGGMQSSRPRSLGDTIRLNEEGIARLRSEGLTIWKLPTSSIVPLSSTGPTD
jgi:hypothetical protein